MNGLTEFLKDCLETVFTLTGSTVCLVGILVGLCIGYLAGAQVRRVRSIGSQRPKRKTGASGNIDGECAFFKGCDLDDLWGYGGSGGSSAWGGGSGSRGDYGASNGGDSTGASTSDARAGGSGG